MSRYRWLLFDADGTLFDYDYAETAALANSFRDFELPYRPDFAQEYREINGQIWRDFELGLIDQKSLRTRRFILLFNSLELDVDPESFSDIYLEHLSKGTYLIDHAEEVLEQLRPGFNLAIITNGLKDVQRPRFARSSIGTYFDVLVISEEIGAAKPDPAIFDAAFNLLGNPPRKEVLIIGDSLTSDIAGGANYGIDTCWFNPSQKSPDISLDIDYEITDLRQLLDILSPR
ncbi:MAG TPA: YjjG family noncanonical pyrimidine nucleotidase [candidate division Zixibacteria bacterium]|nr:YjjG family noncanonical pyrimidine nucleotidase [candidate division Zixibacteria bacterium]